MAGRMAFSGVLSESEVIAGELNEVGVEDLSDFEAIHFLLSEAQQEGPCKLSAAVRPAVRGQASTTPRVNVVLQS